MSTTINSPEDAGQKYSSSANQPSLWSSAAPQKLAKVDDAGPGTDGWNAWRRHLARRKRRGLVKLLKSTDAPLAWAIPEGGLPEFDITADSVALLSRESELSDDDATGSQERYSKEVAEWLSDVQGAPASASLALESLAWCHALPALSGSLPAELWWDLLEQLLQLTSNGAPDLLADPWTQQLLTVELPLTLAWQLPELTRCHDLASRAAQRLHEGFSELLDGRGMLHGRYFAQLRLLLASWTRSMAMAEDLSGKLVSKDDRREYERLVRHALRFTRPDLSLSFGASALPESDKSLLTSAVRLCGDKKLRRVAELVRGEKPASKRATVASDRKLPSPSTQSEWAEVAVMQPAWSGRPAKLAVNYSSRRLATELICGGNLLLAGDWSPRIQADGRALEQQGDWEDVCWVSDSDADYLELEAEFSGGVRVQRQMMLAREDGFLLVCDAVLGTTPADWEYRLALPFADGVSFELANNETREGYLRHESDRLGRVIPLAQPEWLVDPRVGTLAASGGALTLTQQSHQECSFYAPLFIDLVPQRFDRSITWRRLTVAQDRRIERPDVAVGYRVQLGKRQWIVYRSLGELGNRTLLGHNLVSDFLVARFHRSGEVDPLVEVE